jgi:hypothetical protein
LRVSVEWCQGEEDSVDGPAVNRVAWDTVLESPSAVIASTSASTVSRWRAAPRLSLRKRRDERPQLPKAAWHVAGESRKLVPAHDNGGRLARREAALEGLD